MRCNQQGDKVKEISFTYDPFGRRISKIVQREDLDDDNNKNKNDYPKITSYIYDEQNIITEYDQNNKQTASYIYGPNIDEPLSAEIRNNRIYYHADGLGSITALTNHMGMTVQKYDYDAFGNIKFTPFSIWIKQPYLYTAREYDTETGLYYYRARYYDPKVGRFITRDPIGFASEELNLYVYVGNSPLNGTDPTGLKWVWYCKRRLAWSTSKLVSSLFPFFGHCYIKFGDVPLGFYQIPNSPNWTVLDERTPGASTMEGGERALIINRWCSPSWVSDCEYDCLKSKIYVGAQGAPIGGSPLSNNCCTNLDTVKKECKEKCCGK